MKPALLFLLFCLSTIAVAQSNSGGELRNSGTDFVRICGPTVQGQPNQFAGVCNVWLAGVVDGMQAYNANMKVLPLFDAPDITVGQVAKVVVSYVTSHPQQAKLPTAALVLGALVETYPRKAGSTPPKPK
jgi:Rap1a immunity proteins